MKIATWNVNGIRARKTQFIDWISSEKPDIVCLQEIKASPAQVAESVAELTDLAGYTNYWHGNKKGYSGVSLHVRRDAFPGKSPAFSHPPFDMETRIVEARLGDLRIASIYVPNGGKDYPAKLAFLRALGAYVAESPSEHTKFVVCGDLNVAREDKDVHPSERKHEAIGQRADERALFGAIIAGAGLVDVARAMNPENDRMFTWWPYWREARKRNIGWRIDYVLASPSLHFSEIRVSTDVGTSDHAPIITIFEG